MRHRVLVTGACITQDTPHFPWPAKYKPEWSFRWQNKLSQLQTQARTRQVDQRLSTGKLPVPPPLTSAKVDDREACDRGDSRLLDRITCSADKRHIAVYVLKNSPLTVQPKSSTWNAAKTLGGTAGPSTIVQGYVHWILCFKTVTCWLPANHQTVVFGRQSVCYPGFGPHIGT
jgi:hypothetical protein